MCVCVCDLPGTNIGRASNLKRLVTFVFVICLHSIQYQRNVFGRSICFYINPLDSIQSVSYARGVDVSSIKCCCNFKYTSIDKQFSHATLIS